MAPEAPWQWWFANRGKHWTGWRRRAKATGSGFYDGLLSITPPEKIADLFSRTDTLAEKNGVNLLSRADFGVGYYTSVPDAFGSLVPGTYQVTSSGGSGVAPFSASLTVPIDLTWTNQNALTSSGINRANPLTVNWSGGDPTAFAVIVGSSANPNTAGISIGASFTCVAPIGANTFTIPPSVLLSLPATASGGTGVLAVGTVSAPQSFEATGLTAAYLASESTAGGTVTWQ